MYIKERRCSYVLYRLEESPGAHDCVHYTHSCAVLSLLADPDPAGGAGLYGDPIYNTAQDLRAVYCFLEGVRSQNSKRKQAQFRARSMISATKKGLARSANPLNLLVPEVGIEPTRGCPRGILSPKMTNLKSQ